MSAFFLVWVLLHFVVALVGTWLAIRYAVSANYWMSPESAVVMSGDPAWRWYRHRGGRVAGRRLAGGTAA